MFENLQVFRTAHAMARHAGERQSVIARNMANADTPGYAAKDIAGFREIVSKGEQPAFHLRATRALHLDATGPDQLFATEDREGALADPNGNSVTLETEMLHAVETKRQHDRAIAIYRSSLGILRGAMGKR